MRATLNPDSAIYLEYSNEVWNGSLDQWGENMHYATVEALICGEDGSCLCNVNSNLCAFDRDADATDVAWRRIARRDIEIGDIFKSVYGPEAMLTKLRPVLATQCTWRFRYNSSTSFKMCTDHPLAFSRDSRSLLGLDLEVALRTD